MIGCLNFPEVPEGSQEIQKRGFIRFIFRLICRDTLTGVWDQAVRVDVNVMVKRLQLFITVRAIL